MQSKKKKLLIPKTDVVFQALFGTKGNERILEGLLTEILENKVENISLDANQVLVREIPEDKLGILDLRANVGEKISVNIELQLINPYNIAERILYYWAKIYGSQIKAGENYNLLKKTISILIIDFELPELEAFKDAHTEWKLLEKRNTKVIIFKNIEIHIIEIPKWIKNRKETREGLGNWIEFLINPESEMVKMGAKKNIKLKEACEKLEYISEDEKMRRLSELRQKFILDENNRNRVLAEIENRLKEEQKKIEQEGKRVKEKQNELSEKQNELSEKQNELSEKQNELRKEQNELRKKEKNISEKEKNISEKEKNINEEKNKLKEEKKEIVRGLLKMKIPIEKITEFTKLTKEEILEIKEDI